MFDVSIVTRQWRSIFCELLFAILEQVYGMKADRWIMLSW